MKAGSRDASPHAHFREAQPHCTERACGGKSPFASFASHLEAGRPDFAGDGEGT